MSSNSSTHGGFGPMNALEKFYDQAFGRSMRRISGGEEGGEEGGLFIRSYQAAVEKNSAQPQPSENLSTDITGTKIYTTPSGQSVSTEDKSCPCNPVTGGLSAMAEYGNSMFSKAKEQLIRGIAKDVASVLHMKSDFAETVPISDIVEKLQKIVPDPKKKKGLKNDSNIHTEVCSKLADAINKRYDMEIIDKSATPNEICNKVGEIMYSLFTGLHSEFLTVSGDVSRVIKNLQVLKEYVDSANKKLMLSLSKSGEDAYNSEAEAIKTLYDKLSAEIDRQLAILSNLTDSVIGPVGISLITILEESDDFAGLTQDLKKTLGTAEFSEKLGYLLTGTRDVVHAAEVVDKALKKIGMSLKEYKAIDGLKDLKEQVYKKILHKKPTSGDLHKLLAAADMLYRNDMAHEDIVEVLEKKKGGAQAELEQSFADEADFATFTGDDDSPFKGRVQSQRKSISKQLRQQQMYRKQLFSTLNNQVKNHYDKIKYSLSLLSKKIGSEVPLSPELDLFIKQLDNFAASQPDRQNIHIALSGFRKDVTSTFVKHQFTESLYTIMETAKDLEKTNPVFKEISKSIQELIELIVEFNETFTKSLSDIHIDLSHKKGGEGEEFNGESAVDANIVVDAYNATEGYAEGGEGCCGTTGGEISEDALYIETIDEDSNVAGGVEGGAFESALGKVVLFMGESSFNHYKTMKRSIREIDYYYRIAGIKRNLVKTSGEFENNTENYENILGEEAGFIIDQIQTKYNKLIQAVEGTGQGQTALTATEVGKLYAHEYNINNKLVFQRTLEEEIKFLKDNGAPESELEDYVKGYKFLLEYVRSSKIEMLEAAQALDLYLSKFTKEIQFKPDQIKEFVQILEQLEIVAKWFTDKSGDNLAEVFECFSYDSSTTPDQAIANFPTDTILGRTYVQKLTQINAQQQALEFNTSIRNSDCNNKVIQTGEHYYQTLTKAGNGQNFPGRFYIPRMLKRDQAINLVKSIEKSIKSVRALENITATFTKVNTSSSRDVRTFMSSGLMFKAFMKYCVASVISIGYLSLNNDATLTTKKGDSLLFNNNDYNGAAPINVSQAVKSVHAKMAVALKFNKDAVLWVPGEFLELCDPLKTAEAKLVMKDADICDKVFEMSIKSMISKIFVVIGTYSLFNKPVQDQVNSMSLSINPLRQIMGGNEGGASISPIITDAAELYLRLPLLAEWYRKVFEFKKDDTNGRDPRLPRQNTPIISMIPEADSIWGDLLKVIFLDAANIEDGSYPSDYAHRIIVAINDIYKHYKAKTPSITCQEILTEFVLEINRRYGFVMRSEIDKYLDERYKYIEDNEEYPDANRVDYDLLDVDAQTGRKPAPSDRFRTFTKGSSRRSHTIEDLHNAVRRFRMSVEANLILDPSSNVSTTNTQYPSDADFRTIAEVSLTGIVNQTKKKLQSAKDETERYRIIHEQLHGVEKFGDIDQQKMLLFHETVITPLTVLYFTYLILNDFNKFCVSLNMPTDLKDPFYDNLQINVNGAHLGIRQFIRDYNLKNFKGNNNPYSPTQNNQIFDSIFMIEEYGDFVNWKLNNDIIDKYYMDNTRDIPIEELDLMPGGDDRKEAFQRFIYAQSNVMTRLLRKLMNVGCDMNELTEVYFVGAGSNSNHPVFHYDKLEETCKELMESTKQALHNLRKYMPHTLIENIENSTINNQENRISLFYIQENLFERLFNNKYGNGLTDANNGLKNIWTILTKQYTFNGIQSRRGVAPILQRKNNPRFPPGATPDTVINPAPRATLVEVEVSGKSSEDYYYNSFDGVFSKLGYWNIDGLDFSDLLGFRKLSGTQKGLEFPAFYVPVFKSGNTLGNPKSKIERQDVTEKLSISAARVAADNTTLDNEVVIIDNNNDISLGIHNLYDYNDKYAADRTYAADNIDNAQVAGNTQLHQDLGLIPKLNNLVYKYCSLFLNKSNRKIYKPLIEKFVNGHNSKDIIEGKNINDNVYYQSGVGIASCRSAVTRTEPKQGAVLFASLAGALKGIMTAAMTSLTTPIPLHIEDNFANVSEYEKELMRAYLPAFEKELNLIIKKADFLRRCLEETQVRVYKYKVSTSAYDGVSVPAVGAGPLNAPAPTAPITGNAPVSKYTQSNTIPDNLLASVSNGTRKSYLIGIYNDVAMSAKSLLRCIDDVQKELADVPMYFETYKDSLVDYNNRNGYLPLMPISHITHLMNFNALRSGLPDDTPYGTPVTNIDNETASQFRLSLVPIPDQGLGSPEFKFTYGTRGLLHYKQKPDIEFAPGVKSLLESYNSKIGGGASFDKSKMADIVKGTVLLSRWVTDYMYHKQVLDNHDWGHVRKLILHNQLSTNARGAEPTGRYVGNLSCQTAKSSKDTNGYTYWGSTANITMLAENDNLKQSVYRLVSCIISKNENKLYGQERGQFRIFNILDLNIVPINVHAMQREIPFVNILNYSYTFDHLVKNFIGVSTKGLALENIGGEAPYTATPNKKTGDNYNEYSEDDFDSTWHPEDTLVRHLIYPLGFRRLREYVNNTYRLMAGNTSLSLNKPKYLSDQLWNKVLMNSLYNQQIDEQTVAALAAVPPAPDTIPGNRDLNEARRISVVTPYISQNYARGNTTLDHRRRRLVKIYNGIGSYTDIADNTTEPMVSNINLTRTSYLQIANNISYINQKGEVVDIIPYTDNPNTNLVTRTRLSYEGYLRYNSKIIRWVEWFAQIQRVMRLLMRNQLEWVRDPVVQSSDALAEEVTEYKNNNVFQLTDYE